MKIYNPSVSEETSEISVEISFKPEKVNLRKEAIQECADIISFYGTLVNYTKLSDNEFNFIVEISPRNDDMLIEALKLMGCINKNLSMKINSKNLLERKKKSLNILISFNGKVGII